MNLKLFDAYRIIDPRILVVTLEYLGEIRVDWRVSYGIILLRTLGMFVTLIVIAQWIDRKNNFEVVLYPTSDFILRSPR